MKPIFDRIATLKGATELASYSYSYDKMSRITSIVSKDGLANYSYDNTGQIIDVSYGTGHVLENDDEAYRYDENGNRTDGNTWVGKSNQLFEDSNNSYRYDAEGNLTSKTDKATGHHFVYTWDHRGRLTEVKEYDQEGGTLLVESDYQYDAFNRRIAKDVNTNGAGPVEIQERYVHDGDELSLVYDGDGTLIRRYLHGPVIDMFLAEDHYDPISGDYLETYFDLGDHQNSVRDLVVLDGSTAETAQHVVIDSFGNIEELQDGNGDPVGGNPISRWVYTGREYDPETGDYYYRNRYMSDGRFISQDPIGFGSDETNLYRALANSPVKHVDPFGFEAGVLVWAGGAALCDGPSPIGDVVAGGILIGGVIYYGYCWFTTESSDSEDDGGDNAAADSGAETASPNPSTPETENDPGQKKKDTSSDPNKGKSDQPPLKSLHPDSSLKPSSIDFHRKQTTDDIIESLRPGQMEALRVKSDGTIMQWNTRIKILRERGVDVDSLPREVHTSDNSMFPTIPD